MSVYARLTEAAKWNNGENMCDVNMAAAHIERHPLHRTLIHTHICRQIYIHVSASSTGTLTRGSIFPANTCGATFSKYWFLGAGAILRPSNAPGFQVYTDDKWHQVKPINHLKAVSRDVPIKFAVRCNKKKPIVEHSAHQETETRDSEGANVAQLRAWRW